MSTKKKTTVGLKHIKFKIISQTQKNKIIIKKLETIKINLIISLRSLTRVYKNARLLINLHNC